MITKRFEMIVEMATIVGIVSMVLAFHYLFIFGK